MGLLASTFDVECVVFPMRGSHFLAFYGAGYLILDVGYLILESVVFPRRGSRSMGLEGGKSHEISWFFEGWVILEKAHFSRNTQSELQKAPF